MARSRRGRSGALWVVALACAPLLLPGAARADVRARGPALDARATGPSTPRLAAFEAVQLRAERTFEDRETTLALVGRRWRVRGSVASFVAGDVARVEISGPGGRRREVRVPVVEQPGGLGAFVARTAIPAPGRVRVTARVHPDGRADLARVGGPLRVTVVDPVAGRGDRGPLVRVIQRRLTRLRYAAGPVDGIFGRATGAAVLAYRKVNRLRRVETTSATIVLRLLALRGAFVPRHPSHGRHVEADLARQVLALVRGASVRAVYTTSSGKPATPTVTGHFRFYRKEPGLNALGMYYSSYFHRGYAVHGYASVPPYPASHGCLRVPLRDARRIDAFIRLGDRIDVY